MAPLLTDLVLLASHLPGVVAPILQAAETPKPEDVKAGWTGAAVLAGLIVAVVLLLVSMSRHVRKVRRNQDEEALDAELDAERAARGEADPAQ
ncbi:hypothetical protein INN71_03625 [Nocardioides sp. ChNu-153]|uniref:hypothetical protein n=1 Tax=unclassified Nocardioides TaxID=2615069 RepID=UPI002406778E|nr:MULTISPECIES: hypothetical protein [unclassified Nocardioides]MDF9717164.1 hypothetical protein [Nocardioides sp. ChNu-99]MDN7120478.1 hypothetical protein [Nocardioides sp. ChNu-153]